MCLCEKECMVDALLVGIRRPCVQHANKCRKSRFRLHLWVGACECVCLAPSKHFISIWYETAHEIWCHMLTQYTHTHSHSTAQLLWHVFIKQTHCPIYDGMNAKTGTDFNPKRTRIKPLSVFLLEWSKIPTGHDLCSYMLRIHYQSILNQLVNVDVNGCECCVRA